MNSKQKQELKRKIIDTLRIAGTPGLGEWVHLAFTYDNRDVIMYTNGVEVNSFTTGGDVVYSDSYDLTLCWGDRDGYTQDCYVDEFKIWSRTLSADEIKSEYQRVFQTKPFGSNEYVDGNITFGNAGGYFCCGPNDAGTWGCDSGGAC